MTLPGRCCIGGPAKILYPHISVLYAAWSQVQVQMSLVELINFMPHGAASGSVDING